MQKPFPNEERERDAVGLWLVARLALKHERTQASGQQLTDRAISASENQSDRLWKEAIRQEYEALELGAEGV